MQTRKYPRTLNEAFGPYTSNAFDEPAARASWVLRVLYGVLLLVLIGCAIGT